MKLWVAGFNAWGQLQPSEEDETPICSFPDNIYTFKVCLQKADKIDILWSGVSSTLVDVFNKVSIIGSPDEVTEILSQHPNLSSCIALAGNDKVAVIEDQSLKLYNSFHDYKIKNGIDANICQNIIQVVANQTSFTALSSTGDVWTWGDPRYFACLGRDIQDESPASVPCLVGDLHHLPTGPIIKISSGGYVSAALTEGNDLYIWGGRMGHSGIFNDLKSNPTPVDIEGADIVDMAIGFDHILALTSEGKLYVVGYGDCGQLGNGLKLVNNWCEIILSPEQCQNIIKVYAGYKTSFVITD
ncbi:putative serine threonine-protein kinase nek9 [Erysiphe necator]|uniref:Putative serine threonine-protein kinase nek9 n=1 Tax=Uncinula necator TaxID=52586 RepID=A0A0B1PIF8_UNCNE|nr:putative serine threonine-protein kinase nek9 [Erysiphe necator]